MAQSSSTTSPGCNCPMSMCVFAAPSISLILSHLRLVHSSDPNFCVTCGIGGCCTTARSFSALYQHIRKKHKDAGVIQERNIRREEENTSTLLKWRCHRNTKMRCQLLVRIGHLKLRCQTNDTLQVCHRNTTSVSKKFYFNCKH